MAIMVSNFTSNGLKEEEAGTCDICISSFPYQDYDITFKDSETGEEVSYNSNSDYSDEFSVPVVFREIDNIAEFSLYLQGKDAKLPRDWEAAYDLIKDYFDYKNG